MIDWEQAAAAGPAVCGGKGHVLGRLARYGFRVPQGGVLIADAYRASMEQETLRRAIQEGKPAELPADIRAAVRAFLEEHRLTDAPVAVRSSATGEDSARASFAGIHRSVLSVRGAEAVERAIFDCYASLWTPHARAYRQKMGFAEDEVACAVAICRMVVRDGADEPACAGVAFSADPRTGRRDCFVVEAVPGLGEKLVSGRATPQRFVFRVSHDMPVLEDAPENPLLAPAQLDELAWTLNRIHWDFGDGQDPQDVEWAHDGERLWILQARPITRMPRGGPQALQRYPQYWSTANIKDSMPGVICDLSWSALQAVVATVAFAGLHAAGYHEVDGWELVRRFHGRAYFDVTLMEWAFYDGFGLPAEVSARTLGGHQPNIETPPGDPLKGPEGARRRKAQFRLFRALWGFEKKRTPYFRRCIAEMRALASQDLRDKSIPELAEIFDRIKAKGAELAPLAGLANAASGRWFTPMEQALARWFGPRAPALVAALSAGSGEVTSAEQGYRIGGLVRTAQKDPAAMAWLQSSDLRNWSALPEGSPFRRALAAFLDDFGHRAFGEPDLWDPRWVEDPAPLLRHVRDQAAAGTVTGLREAAQERRLAAEREIKARLPLLAPIVRWAAGGLRRAWAVRELGKSALVASILPVRRLVFELGRRMVDSGRIDQPQHLLHLADCDLNCLLNGYWDGSGLRELVSDRAARREAWLREEAPDVIAGEGAVDLPPVEPSVSVNGVWKGIAVSAGQVTGIGRVVRRAEDGTQLRPGEILVAPATDSSWTPLFLRASGVVMEMGGYLSHGSIVAREYGLPAVANIPGLLRQLKDGDTLRVNGDLGTLERL